MLGGKGSGTSSGFVSAHDIRNNIGEDDTCVRREVFKSADDVSCPVTMLMCIIIQTVIYLINLAVI